MIKVGDMFKETDGKLSFARISCGIILLGWIVWVSYSVYRTATLPANMWEISAPLSSVYGLNKLSNAMTSSKKDDSSNG